MATTTYKYRIYPNKTTADKLQWVLDRCRELYNAALSERKDAWRMAHQSIGYYEQQHDLVEIKEIRPEYQEIASHVLQDVIGRIKRAFDNFFRRVKNGEKPGYPRFKGSKWYDSFTYPDKAGWNLDTRTCPPGKRGMVKANLHLTKIGTMKLHLHRDLVGTIKTLTIKREGEHWYACFTCEVGTPKPLPISYEDVGIDLGVTHFAALSNSEFIEYPRYYRRAEKKLKTLQAALSRKERGSHRRARAVKRVARVHRTIKNQRRDFHHKASRTLVNRYQVIVFENLQAKNLTKAPKPKQDETTGQYLPNGAAAKAGLNKSILDAGWATFTEMVSVKAASAGRTVVFVDPFKTSQKCSSCRKEGPHKDLAERVHRCPHCGLVLDRDTNAAINILRDGHNQLSGRDASNAGGVEAPV
ncbi:MAG: transposase [Chloroflexota bacterium]|nr:transposase [Chloroflexota bacterium]